jgi:hypothetical protein
LYTRARVKQFAPTADRSGVNVNVSGPVRVFALVGGLAALALGVWFFLLGGLSPTASSEPVKAIKPLYSGKTASAVPATKPSVARKPSASAPKRTSTPVATPKPKPKARPAKIANPEKLPLALARALTRHAVVVVSLYDPEAKVDRISLGEARAGARRARVGFVALNVLDRRASEALTRKLGVLSAPAFFLYKRPGQLVMRIDGFADRDLVAQAAVSSLPPALRRSLPARRAQAAPVTQARWSGRANAICREGSGISNARPTTRAQLLAAWPRELAEFKRSVGRLRALPLPTSPAARVRTQKLLATWDAVHVLAIQFLDAVKANDAARIGAGLTRLGERGQAANRLAAELGAATCTVT